MFHIAGRRNLRRQTVRRRGTPLYNHVPCQVSLTTESLEDRLLLHFPHDPVVIVALSPNFAADQMLLAVDGKERILSKSVDGGRTFYTPTDDVAHRGVAAISFSPQFASDNTVFAGTQSGSVYKSTDGGETWNRSGNGISTFDISAIITSPNFATDQTVFAGTRVGDIYRSTNGGQSWQLVYDAGDTRVSEIVFSPNFANDQTLFAAIEGVGVAKSIDGGTNWTLSTLGLTGPTVTSLAISQQFQQDQKLFAGVSGQGVMISTDGGTNWIKSSQGLTELNIPDIEVVDAQTIVATTASKGVFRSKNGGTTWQVINSGIELFNGPVADAISTLFDDVTVSPNYAVDQRLYLAAYAGFYHSENGGNTWIESEFVPPKLNTELAISPNYANDGTIFTSTYGGGVMRTVDSGVNWTFQNAGLAHNAFYNVVLSPEYATDRTVFAGMFQGVEISKDGGQTWALSQLVPNSPVNGRTIAVSPTYATDRTVFAGGLNFTDPSKSGLYRSTNGGTTWQRITTGLPTNPDIVSFAISPNYAVDGTVFLGVEDGGAFKSTDFGLTWTRTDVGDPNETVYELALSPNFVNDRTVFAGVKRGGVYKSVDAGATWVRMVDGFPYPDALAINLSPNYANDSTVFASAGVGGVYKSTDGGNTWQTANTGLVPTLVRAIDISRNYANDQTLAAATVDGTFLSQDGGATWKRIQNVSRYEDTNERLKYQGQWSSSFGSSLSSSSARYSTTQGNSVTLEFVGTGFRWFGSKGTDHGRASIFVDGQLVQDVDLNAPAQSSTLIAEVMGLERGFHTLEIRVLQNRRVMVDAIDVFDFNSPNTPTIANSATPLTYANNSPATVIDDALTIGDVDSAGLVGATVSITAGFVSGQDVLSFVNQNGITGSYNASTGVLTLTGIASLANYQAALRSVKYFNSSGNPSTVDRLVTFAVNDGRHIAVDDRTIQVTIVPFDIRLDQVAATGQTSFTLNYTIAGNVATAFTVGFYRSTDAVFGAGDTLLDTITISDAADLTIDAHTKTFTIGSGANVSLPGLGITETDEDYHLLVVADPNNAVAEADTDPFGEDNTALFTGVYRSSSNVVFVHGTLANDTLTINTTGGISIILNGVTTTYTAASVSSIRVRTHAGNDSVTNSATKTLRIYGGDGIDTLTGANTAGTWTISGVNSGTLGATSFFSVESAIGGTANDSFNFQGSGNLSGPVDGGLGNNTIDYRTLTTAIVVDLSTGAATRTGGVTNIQNVVGGSGHDTITGNTQDNILHGGGGNDTINGGAGGNDILVGSVGNDTLTAGPGRSILIGGAGMDILTGGASQDLLIGSATNFDNNGTALNALMAEWKRTDIGYSERIAHLRGTTSGGLNGNTKLTTSTVPNDNAADQLFGLGDLDWFWSPIAEVKDREVGETVSP